MLWVGHHYRIEGDLLSRGVVDVDRLRRTLEAFAGARDVQIGERPPHRIAFTGTMRLTRRVRLGSVWPMTPEIQLLLRSAREVKGPEVVVGGRARGVRRRRSR